MSRRVRLTIRQTLWDAETSQMCGTPPESDELDDEQGEDTEHGQGESIGLNEDR